MKFWIVSVGEPIPGIEGSVREMRATMLTRFLLKKGHEVVRWTSTFSHRTKEFLFRENRRIDGESGLSYRFLHGLGYRNNRSLRRILHNHREAHNFTSTVNSEAKPDCVFCCYPTPDLASASVEYGRRNQILTFVDVRDLWPDVFLAAFPKQLRRWFAPLLAVPRRRLHSIFTTSTGVTAVSQSYLKWALAHAHRSPSEFTHVFPIGCVPQKTGNPEEFQRQEEMVLNRLRISRNTFLIVFAGTFVSSCDFRTVTEAARIRESSGDTSVHFVFAGRGSYEASLRKSAEGLTTMHFAGWLQPKELEALLRVAKVGLCPYRRGASQSLPNKPFEYFAAGLPLLSSLEGELRTVIDQHNVGVHYTSGDPAGLSETIQRLSERNTDLERYAVNAKKLFTSTYSADVVYDQFSNFLENCAKSYLTQHTT